ncbi:MAG TPA: DUF3047 domain-containing protein [Myxococcales bacterium]|nr:DUF3047 domain-containing protein [Myxococcales bacterium]
MNFGATSLGLALPLLLALGSADTPVHGSQTTAPVTRPQLSETPVDVRSFKVVEGYSGPVSYYRLVEDPESAYIRAVYRPPLETVTLAAEVPDALRQRTKYVRWKWRAQVLPKHGNECAPGFGDSAAVIYISWKRGLKWYSIKYVWSTDGAKGSVCDKKRNMFVVQDTVILESGGPTGIWKEEQIDPSAEFRAHFEGDVPDFVGIGLMSDGDQTNSVSAADYAGFVLVH